jgi:hypothetical protein
MQRALGFLNQQPAAQGFPSFVSEHTDFAERTLSAPEIFSSMLVLVCLREAELELDSRVELLDAVQAAFTAEGWMHFFQDKTLLPPDVDCTGVALGLMLDEGRTLPFDVHATLDRIAANVDRDGIVRVYINPDTSRAQRLDAAACVNALYAFCRAGRESDIPATQAYIANHLASDRFDRGTRYYPSPDMFLFFISRLIHDFEAPRRRFGQLAQVRLGQRLGRAPANLLEAAARVAAADNLGMVAEQELAMLVEAQRDDGSWPAASCFRFGRTARYFGSESLSTALGVRALMAAGAARQVPMQNPTSSERLQAIR